MSENNMLTKEERKSVVLGVHKIDNMYGTVKGKPTDRFFIYDCNTAVLDKKFNQRLRDFLQEAITHYDPSDLELFRVTYKADANKSLGERVDYVRYIDDVKGLAKLLEDVCKFDTSEYYGYTDVHVEKITINAFPEIRTFTINEDKYRDKSEDIKHE